MKRPLILIALIVASALGLFCWTKFIYPQLIFSHLTIDRRQALDIAKDALIKRDVDVSRFNSAIVFTFDSQTNQFLQSSIGFEGLKRFIIKHDFDMYFWLVRFFKENQKEEYRLTISSNTGEVTSLRHVMEASEARRTIDASEAQATALDFLKKKYNLNESLYEKTDQFTKVLDNRTEYTFAWQKREVNIPWSKTDKSGTGKLYISATVAGDEVTHFVKNFFSVPDQFIRFIEQEQNTGRILSRVIRMCYIALFVAATFFLIARRNHLGMHTVKPFYIWAAGVFFVLAVISEINDIQYAIFNYKNTSSFNLYFWEFYSERLIQIFFATIVIIIPGLAGEMLHHEVSKNEKHGSLLHYIRSTFFSREVGFLILIGYVVFAVMIGLQSALIKFGQNHLGVWVEHNWMAKYSTSHWPFLGALVAGYRAAFTEEILYRLFAINWLRKVFKNTVLAAILSALVWGFAHSSYPVFPMWFRGVEMTVIGIFMAFVYFRYGLIACIVGHYLFNVFWNSTDYFFGQSNPFYLYSSLAIFLFPLVIAVICFVLNKKDQEKKLNWRLNKHQVHNVEVLKTYLVANELKFKGHNMTVLRQEICSHGWDLAVVDVALEELGWLKLDEN